MVTTKENKDIVCIGDLMIEYPLHIPSLPRTENTLILDSITPELGGPAFNLSWYFSNLERQSLLVGTYGLHNRTLVTKALSRAKLDDAGLVMTKGETDMLIDIFTGHHKRSIYLRSSITDEIGQEIILRCGTPKRLVMTGSRHLETRKIFQKLADSFRGDLLAFNPSYAIYEYERKEFINLIEKAHVIIFNEQEAEHACKLLNMRNHNQLLKKVRDVLIITLGKNGVKLYKQQKCVQSSSHVSKSTNAVGAGDAFFAGFLHKTFDGVSLEEAVHFGSVMAAYVVESTEVRVHVSEDQIQQRINTNTSE